MSTKNEVEMVAEPNNSRRRFLVNTALWLGVPALGLEWAHARQTPDYQGAAYQSWSAKNRPTGLSDAHYVVLCGTLAANPHNSQPWKFKVTPTRIDIFADRDRWLGAADPEHRLMQMGVGCAIENMRIAANNLGYQPQVEFVAQDRFDADGQCAVMHLLPGQGRKDEQTFAALFNRQTTRGAYLPQAVPASVLNQLGQNCQQPGIHLTWYAADSDGGRELVRSTRHSVRDWVNDQQRFLDSMKWWRYTRQEWVQKRDGISIYTSDAPYFLKEGLQDLTSPSMWQGDFGKGGEVKTVDQACSSTPTWGLIYADRASPEMRLRAGMLAERIYVDAEAAGYSVCPLNYPTELTAASREMAYSLALPADAEPLIVFRIGKPEQKLERSVRRDLSTVLI